MLNPIKEQIETMKSAIQELKDAENESEFNSVTSGSPGKEERRKSQGDIPIISVETLAEVRRKIDSLGEELRQDFHSRVEEGDKTWKGELHGHQRRLPTHRKTFKNN